MSLGQQIHHDKSGDCPACALTSSLHSFYFVFFFLFFVVRFFSVILSPIRAHAMRSRCASNKEGKHVNYSRRYNLVSLPVAFFVVVSSRELLISSCDMQHHFEYML